MRLLINESEEVEPMQKLLATALLSAFALVQTPAFAEEKKAEPAKAEANKAEPAKTEAKKEDAKPAEAKTDQKKKPKKGGC
jgi:hypothetical protein